MDSIFFLAKRFLFLVQSRLVAYYLVAYVVLLRRVCFCSGGVARCLVANVLALRYVVANAKVNLAAEKHRPSLSRRGSGSKSHSKTVTLFLKLFFITPQAPSWDAIPHTEDNLLPS